MTNVNLDDSTRPASGATTASGGATLNLQDLVKAYDIEPVVKGINLTIEDGEMLSLLGPSGCGKTTTLRMIAGLEAVTAGKISVGGQLLSSGTSQVPPEKRNMGMVFQTYALWPHKDVFGNVAYALQRKKLPKETIQAEVQRVLSLVGLGHLSHRYPSELSGGQQQRVALARAIAHNPGVLLFDEPLSNLDAVLRDSMRYEIRQLQQKLGTTGVYVTHSQDEALALSDKIAIMSDGNIIQHGSPEEIYERPATAFTATFIGKANILPIAEAARVGESIRGTLSSGDVIGAGSRAAAFEEGRSSLVAIRPENILVTAIDSSNINRASSEKEIHLRGTVTEAIFTGGIIDYVVQIGELKIQSRSTPPFRVREGDDAFVSFNADDVVLLDD